MGDKNDVTVRFKITNMKHLKKCKPYLLLSQQMGDFKYLFIDRLFFSLSLFLFSISKVRTQYRKYDKVPKANANTLLKYTYYFYFFR